MNYLPEGYEELKTNSSYLSLSKLSEGEHRFRIVQRPIAGWVDWKDNKPYRYRPDQRPDSSFDNDKPMRPFWACYLWDYAQEGLFVVEITQSSIMKSLTQFGKDSDWGDFTQYDIKIHKQGSGKDTKYHVAPVPHKAMSEQIQAELKSNPVVLENLYNGGDPWQTVGESPGCITAKEAEYLEGLLAKMPDLKANILAFIKDKGCGTTLKDLPSSLYEKVCDRAHAAQKEQEEAAKAQEKKGAQLLNVDFTAPSVHEDVLPF